jgi:hypothetical protein
MDLLRELHTRNTRKASDCGEVQIVEHNSVMEVASTGVGIKSPSMFFSDTRLDLTFALVQVMGGGFTRLLNVTVVC